MFARIIRSTAVLAVGSLCLVGCSDEHSGDDVIIAGPPQPQGTEPIEVVYGNQTVRISLDPAQGSADSAVSLVGIWNAADIDVPVEGLSFELEAADGYRPSYLGCPDVPGEDLRFGQVSRYDLDVSWAAQLDYDQCYEIHELHVMRARDTTDPDAGAGGGAGGG